MAGSNKLKPSKALQGRYDVYKSMGKVKFNAARNLARHIKKFPNDESAKAALKKVDSRSVRSAPNKKLGWVTPAVAELATASTPYLPPGVAKVSSNNVTKQSAIQAARTLKIIGLARRSETPVFDKEGNIVLKHVKIISAETGKNLSRITSQTAEARILKEELRVEREAAKAASDAIAAIAAAKPQKPHHKAKHSGKKPQAK